MPFAAATLAARVVRAQRASRATEQRRQRYAGSDRERVLPRNIQQRQRLARDAGHAEQREAPLERIGYRLALNPSRR
jgi:hypothetical protein